MRRHFASSGQSLIELLIALTLVVIVVVAVVGLAAVSIKTAYFAKRETVAKRYAEQAIEWLREYKKSNWYDLLNNRADTNPDNIDFCLDNLNFNSRGGCGSDRLLDNIYMRELQLYKYDLGVGRQPKIRVTVTVVWKDSSRDHATNLTSILVSPD